MVTIGGDDFTDGRNSGPGRHQQSQGARSTVDAMPDDGAAPDAIFTPEDGLAELWAKAYQGEILGELLFGGIAEQLGDPDQAAKMRMLATLEQRTKEAVAPALERAGISTRPDPETVATAEALLQGAVALTWSDLMSIFGPITAQYIPLYQRIGELSPAERDTADLLVAHERALRDFARAEVDGDGARSLEPITALAHMG
jgi:hypothetical protein